MEFISSDVNSQYEWSCSPLSINNSYTLPDLDFKTVENIDNVVGVTNDVTDVFPIPPTLNCSGTVSAIDYCYIGREDSLIYGMRYLIFTLVTLEQENLTFTITDVIPVHSTPTAQKCIMQTNDLYCCDSLQLNTTHQFNLPVPNFAFGMIRSTSQEIRQLRYRNRVNMGRFIPEFLVEQYNFDTTQDLDTPQAGDIFRLNDSSRTLDRGLRIIQFTISKTNTYSQYGKGCLQPIICISLHNHYLIFHSSHFWWCHYRSHQRNYLR